MTLQWRTHTYAWGVLTHSECETHTHTSSHINTSHDVNTNQAHTFKINLPNPNEHILPLVMCFLLLTKTSSWQIKLGNDLCLSNDTEMNWRRHLCLCVCLHACHLGHGSVIRAKSNCYKLCCICVCVCERDRHLCHRSVMRTDVNCSRI